MLDLEADKFLIIERVLEHGGDRQIEFVFSQFQTRGYHMCGATELLSESKDCQLLVFIFNLKREGYEVLPEAIPASVATLLNDIHTWPLPVDTYMAGGTAVAIYSESQYLPKII